MNFQRETAQEKDRAMGIYEKYPWITLPSTATIAKPGKGIDLQVLCMLRDMGQVIGGPRGMEMMKAAGFPGCPQSIIARFTQELSHFLMRERHKYTHANPQVRSLQKLCKTLTALKMNTKWASTFITQQRAVQIWEPILGPEHRKIKTMRDNIAIMRANKK